MRREQDAANENSPSRWILPFLVLAQLFGTSLWFSSSAALPSLIADWGLSPSDGGLLVSAVQVGFILGTLIFALTNLADIFPASKVFLTSAVLGAAVNVMFAYFSSQLGEALVFRFLTGLALAGIYPVGMKVVVGWSPGGVGNALGWLIGALTIGSATPFLLTAAGTDLPWQTIIMFSSALAVGSGLVVAWVGDGPYLGSAQKLDYRMLYQVFRFRGYRRAALGYFGHMWELYAFWVLSPLLVAAGLAALGWNEPRWISLGTFAVIGIGAVGCIGGGLLSGRLGSRKVASISLAVSGAMCLLTPLLLQVHGLLFLGALLIWGIFVVSDSAQFSAMSAQACPRRYVGTALTVQNSIGFAITIISIEWASRLWSALGPNVAWLLAPGPLLGLLLLNWRAGQDPVLDWDDVDSARTVEDFVAYPLVDYAAPERSGGPSLF
ncbi:MAG: MFS transporter [SAR324 cluster bacterium]|nr:MFS transporter [SAR324 cluster bacterium]